MGSGMVKWLNGYEFDAAEGYNFPMRDEAEP